VWFDRLTILSKVKGTLSEVECVNSLNLKNAITPSPFILSPREREGRGGCIKKFSFLMRQTCFNCSFQVKVYLEQKLGSRLYNPDSTFPS